MDDLKLIKRHYGEKLSHLCRKYFPTILEEEGRLFDIISRKFAYSRLLYDDIINNHYEEEFKNIVYNQYDNTKDEDINEIIKAPQELLDEAGYVLYECHSEDDIQEFKKYYTDKEKLCTFNGDRLERCRVFFAVKKNVDEIKREDFRGKEDRQDEYGTSVISIQFTKDNRNTLSIKNRYNHTVSNPDATFSNNLENIIPGLTRSFEKYYNLHINSNITERDLPGYTLASDGRYYKYNFEKDNIYYCPNNVIIDHFDAHQYDTSRYLIIDNLILDMKEKTFETLEMKNNPAKDDSFCCLHRPISSIRVENKDNNTKEIILDGDIVITINDKNEIIKYKNHHDIEKNIYLGFLNENRALEELDAPNIRWIWGNFLKNNTKLKRINLPNVEIIGDNFLKNNVVLEKINIPNCKKIGKKFLANNKGLWSITIPNVEIVGDDFLKENEKLSYINAPKLQHIGDDFLSRNNSSDNHGLLHLYLPECLDVGNDFLFGNRKLRKLEAPKLTNIGCRFMNQNKYMEEIDLPELQATCTQFLSNNKLIKKVNLPKLRIAGFWFLGYNDSLKELILPELYIIHPYFLADNEVLRKFEAPNLTLINDPFIPKNKSLRELRLPSVTKIYGIFLRENKVIKHIELPSLKHIEDKNFYKKYMALIKQEEERKTQSQIDKAKQMLKRG